MARLLTNLEHALLGLVHQAPTTGYDLCKVFDATPMGHYSSSPGSIYPALKRLEERGLIRGEVEKGQSMRPRRLFRTTEAGTAELRSWASIPPTREALMRDSDELLLRFAFMEGLVGRETVLAFLDRLASLADSIVDGLVAHHATMQRDEVAAGTPNTGRLALQHGIESYRVLARWSRASRAELSNLTGSGEEP